MASPGQPTAGLGYMFYVILRIISHGAGERSTRNRKYGKVVLPTTLSFVASMMVILILILSH